MEHRRSGTVHKLTVVGDQFVSDWLSVNIYEAERKEIWIFCR